MLFQEQLRRASRRLFPRKAFTAVSSTADYYSAWRTLPFDEARQLARILQEAREDGAEPPTAFHPRTLEHPFFIRPRHSDARSFTGTCIRSEYAPVLPIGQPDYIVDAGAFTGDCSALILTRFPAARLVALEPQPDAFALASRNLQPYGPRAVVRNAALWSEDCELSLDGSGIGASVSSPVVDGEVTAISMTSVLTSAEFPRVDLFKCDIEGAETEVFSRGDLAWLQRTDRILIELHSAEAAATVKTACSRAGLDYAGQYRSTHVFQRRRAAGRSL